MGLNDRASAERVHIAFFGLRNAGKSSLVNAVTGQRLSLVSEIKGTTTDPVKKAMEILPLGPVVIIDTPGIDDEGELGEMRVTRARQTLDQADIAVLVIDAQRGKTAADEELCREFTARKIPYIAAYNKCDLLESDAPIPIRDNGNNENSIMVSAETGLNIHELKEMLGRLTESEESREKSRRLAGDLFSPGDVIVLVTPIDESAPKGRMILPQQQMIREVLDNGAINIVVKETELDDALKKLAVRPKMVVTDSQAFGKVSKIVPDDILLTSFSILFARYKGELETAVIGAAALDKLKDGDVVLISEGCTHHRQCGDIGTVKLPNWISGYTGKSLQYEFTSGGEFPEELSGYSLVVHCGGCMLTEREMKSRIRRAASSGVPITNYGIAIAQIHGILRRSLSPFPELAEKL